jgi:hypothetical protein
MKFEVTRYIIKVDAVDNIILITVSSSGHLLQPFSFKGLSTAFSSRCLLQPSLASFLEPNWHDKVQ